MIRRANAADVERIADIYNAAILEGGLTGDLDPLPIDNRRAWYIEHREPYAIFVRCVDRVVVGYAALSPYRAGRSGFDRTCEISYYLSAKHRGAGHGKELVGHAIGQAESAGFRLIVAMVLDCNQRSIGLLTTLGFSISGRLPAAARIDGQDVDHVYMTRPLR